jgi:hypothetical protein
LWKKYSGNGKTWIFLTGARFAFVNKPTHMAMDIITINDKSIMSRSILSFIADLRLVK